ncbi:hypothetical protein [Virgisporangium aurantiacum]|uniref:Secreted protein n=1 Tax=Virgisporangium aurantiacum TaxID=175570 RepID=A0A8J3ZHU4_9ACTN|nr:hypothetical protein [Virgisporangium aurantiacum]GIJ64169.1 hypothetical protein Vau01_116850 [Virgisporangium aurantiacum]
MTSRRPVLFAAACLCVAVGATLGALRHAGIIYADSIHTDPVPPATTRVVPACTDAFRPGQPIAIGIDFTCTDPTGHRQYLDAFRCTDGRHLITVEPRTGAPQGWGHDGGPFHLGNSAIDPVYRRTYQDCIG